MRRVRIPRRRKRPDKDYVPERMPDNDKAPRLATQGRKKRCKRNSNKYSDKRIMKQLLIMLSALIIAGCSPRVFPVQRDTITQVRTEIVERLVRDTIEISLPQDSVYVQTKDTTSVLRISTAISEASVSGGVLAHSLYSNPDYKPEIEVVYKDRIEYRDTTIVSSNTEVIPRSLKWRSNSTAGRRL